MTKPRTNSTSRYLPAYCLYLLSVYPLRGVGWGCCQSPPRCHWLKTVRQKKSYLETFVSHKKRKALILPTGVRDRDRPQISPPIGWHLVQNPTSLTTQQQILKAYMQPPPSVRRCRTASKTRRATFNFNPHCGSASENGSVGSCFRLVFSYFGCRDAVYLSFIISPGGNRADKELYSH